MKKMLIVAALLAAAFAFGCSNGNKPSATVKNYLSAVVDGDYEKAVDCVDVEAEERGELVELMRTKVDQSLKEQNGIKSFKVLDEQIDSDGERATVNVQLTYGDDKTEENKYVLIKKDDTWLIDPATK